ncbi:MAG: SDR family NAD(P)-dependent oxidoreductase [Myxococcales bacterium]
MTVTPEQLATVLALLESTHDLEPSSPEFLALERAVAHLAKSAKKKRRLERSLKTRAGDAALTQRTGLEKKRLGATSGAPSSGASPGRLQRERACYACKRPYVELHPWYPSMCPECGAKSLAMRDRPIVLEGRRALLTGGRVKIGQAIALRMLRAGAEVHLTTRFPRDAARRYGAEPDAERWRDRLHIHGLDFRDLRRLLDALEAWRRGPAFDIVINNAAQSVWHPPSYFQELHALERAEACAEGPQAPSSVAEALVPLLAQTSLERLDLDWEDSWVQSLGEIAPVEMVEVQVVNAIAPFLICSLLRDNLARSPFADRYIVNVSAVEGQFARQEKTVRHPHNNMAKAALNMLTRTSAADLAADGIHMVSVDPGWMSAEGKYVESSRVLMPLEAEDCAARILHPIAEGIAGRPLSGVLLKDFVEVPW